MIRVDIDKHGLTNGEYVDKVLAVCQLFGIDPSNMKRFVRLNNEDYHMSGIIDEAFGHLKDAGVQVRETQEKLCVWK